MATRSVERGSEGGQTANSSRRPALPSASASCKERTLIGSFASASLPQMPHGQVQVRRRWRKDVWKVLQERLEVCVCEAK
jgi:hypothetical protein